MDNFLDRIRHGAGKAAFEADKLRRVTVVQSAIKALQKEVERAYYQIGRAAYELYGDGRINQPELQKTCDQLATLQAQIAAHEQEIASIRAEEFVEPQVSARPQYGRICPNGHGAIPEGDTFCQTCGAKAIYVPPPVTQPMGGTAVCANCGAPLAAQARFCAECGHSVPETVAVVEPVPASGVCAACGAVLLPGAIFCAECGHRVEVEAEEITEPEPFVPVEPVVEVIVHFVAEPMVSEWGEVVEGVGETAVTPQTDESKTADTPPFDSQNDVIDAVVGESTSPETGACPKCGALLLSDATFCAECGYRIS